MPNGLCTLGLFRIISDPWFFWAFFRQSLLYIAGPCRTKRVVLRLLRNVLPFFTFTATQWPVAAFLPPSRWELRGCVTQRRCCENWERHRKKKSKCLDVASCNLNASDWWASFHEFPPTVQVPRFARGVETWIISLRLMPKRLGAKLGKGFLLLIDAYWFRSYCAWRTFILIVGVQILQCDIMQHSGHNIFGIFQLMLNLWSIQVCHEVSLHRLVRGQVNEPERSRVHLSEIHLKTPRQCGKRHIIPYHSISFRIILHTAFHIIPSYLTEGLNKSSEHRPLRKAGVWLHIDAARILRPA